MFKYISLLFFFGGIVGFIFCLSGFLYLEPTMANLFIIFLGLMFTFAMFASAGYDLIKGKD